MNDSQDYFDRLESKRDSLEAKMRWVKSIRRKIDSLAQLPGVAVTQIGWCDVHIDAEKHSRVKATFRFDNKEPVDELLAGPWDDVSLTKPETETRYKLDVEANTA